MRPGTPSRPRRWSAPSLDSGLAAERAALEDEEEEGEDVDLESLKNETDETETTAEAADDVAEVEEEVPVQKRALVIGGASPGSRPLSTWPTRGYR